MSKRRPTSTRVATDAAGFAACVGMVAAAYWFGIHGFLAAKTSAQTQSSEIQTLQSEIDTRTMKTEHLKSSIATVERELEKNGVTLADATELTQKLLMLGQLAEAHGIVIDSTVPRTIEADEGFDRQPIMLRCSGTYPACVSMLREMRAADRTLALRSAQLRRVGEEGKAVLDAEIVWFVQPHPDVSGENPKQ